MFVKHFITLLILYFALDFTSTVPHSPTDTLKMSVLIYTLFILFTKMNIQFTLIAFMLLATTYILSTYINYYKDEDGENPIIEKLVKIRKSLYVIILGIILLGFSLYFIKQRNSYTKNWSTIKFLFGTTKCKSLK
mgnify:CR=1 FL=1